MVQYRLDPTGHAVETGNLQGQRPAIGSSSDFSKFTSQPNTLHILY